MRATSLETYKFVLYYIDTSARSAIIFFVVYYKDTKIQKMFNLSN